jgi:hypothetical protein
MKILLPLLSLLLAACSSGKATSKSGSSVTPPANAETPSSISESTANEVLDLPKNSTIVEEKIAATDTAPAVDRRTITVASDTVQKTVTNDSQVIVSPPRPPDKTVELYKARAEDRKPLLIWAGIAFAAGIITRGFIPAWPSISNGCFGAAIVLLGAWKFAEIPWWASLFVIGLVVVMILFYKRGEWDRDSDWVPDVIQKKRQPPPPTDQ